MRTSLFDKAIQLIAAMTVSIANLWSLAFIGTHNANCTPFESVFALAVFIVTGFVLIGFAALAWEEQNNERVDE